MYYFWLEFWFLIIYFFLDYGEVGIDLNVNIGFDLVFVIDIISSVGCIDFLIGLSFVKMFVRKIGISKRYDLYMIVGIEF